MTRKRSTPAGAADPPSTSVDVLPERIQRAIRKHIAAVFDEMATSSNVLTLDFQRITGKGDLKASLILPSEFENEIADMAVWIVKQGWAGIPKEEMSDEQTRTLSAELVPHVLRHLPDARLESLWGLLAEIQSTTAAFALCDWLQELHPDLYDRTTKATILGHAQQLIKDCANDRRKRLDARGGRNPQVDADDDAIVARGRDRLKPIWEKIAKLRVEYDSWSEMSALGVITRLSKDERANAKRLLEKLDQTGKTLRASYLAQEHAAMNEGRDDLLELSPKALYHRLLTARRATGGSEIN